MQAIKRLALALLLAWAGSLPAQEPTAAAVQWRDYPRERVLDGVVEAVDRSTVSAQTGGRVQELLVDVNDYVERGQPILRLRDVEQRAALDQARAALQEAEARYREAQAEYRRVEGVFRRKLVSQAQMDAASSALSAAHARLEGARAGVEQAREQLDNTVIQAPYSGVVLARHVELGETVQPGTPLMTGFSLARLRVVAQVPQGLIHRVRDQAQARVLLAGGSVAAETLTFFPYADPASNVFRVRIGLPEGLEGVYPGMFVKAVFTLGTEQRLVVPRQAVVQRSEVSGVYVLADGRPPALRQVRLGRLLEDGLVEVLAGLEAGEQVALDPLAAGVRLKGGGS